SEAGMTKWCGLGAGALLMLSGCGGSTISQDAQSVDVPATNAAESGDTSADTPPANTPPGDTPPVDPGGSGTPPSSGAISVTVPASYYDPGGTVIYADEPTMRQIRDASPGDVLLFEPGEHDRIDIDDFVSTECDPLVLTSLDPENPAVIKNSTIPGWEALGIGNSEYVVIENLIVEGGLSGILIQGSSHVIVTRSEIRLTNHSGLAVNSRSQHVDFIGNVIHDTGQSEPKWGEGIYLGTAAAKDDNDITTHVWIEGNEIYNTGFGEAVDMKGGVRFSTVRANHVHDIRLGIENGQTNEAAIVMGYSSAEPAHNWVEYNLVEDVSWGGGGEAGRPNVGASGIAAFGGGNYLHNNTITNVLEYGVYFNGFGDPGFFVYEWDNSVSNAGYEDYRGNLDSLTRSDPGITNPNQRQSWCSN
ncbi:MAG: right-handed parallel beta-helix repeat-containing protein, partial [Myxococcota bacterium]